MARQLSNLLVKYCVTGQTDRQLKTFADIQETVQSYLHHLRLSFGLGASIILSHKKKDCTDKQKKLIDYGIRSKSVLTLYAFKPMNTQTYTIKVKCPSEKIIDLKVSNTVSFDIISHKLQDRTGHSVSSFQLYHNQKVVQSNACPLKLYKGVSDAFVMKMKETGGMY